MRASRQISPIAHCQFSVASCCIWRLHKSMANTTLQYQSMNIVTQVNLMSRHDSNSYSCFITMFTFTPTLHTPLSPSVLHRHRACHCSEQRNLVKYHSDNVVISLSGAESMLGYSYMYLPHHQWVSQEGEIFRWSSPDTLSSATQCLLYLQQFRAVTCNQ